MNFQSYNLTLDQGYIMKQGRKKRLVFLVRTTKKGFNLQDRDTGKNVFEKHLYAQGMSKKPIPPDMKEFSFTVPYYKDAIWLIKLPKGYLRVSEGKYL